MFSKSNLNFPRDNVEPLGPYDFCARACPGSLRSSRHKASNLLSCPSLCLMASTSNVTIAFSFETGRKDAKSD